MKFAYMQPQNRYSYHAWAKKIFAPFNFSGKPVVSWTLIYGMCWALLPNYLKNIWAICRLQAYLEGSVCII